MLQHVDTKKCEIAINCCIKSSIVVIFNIYGKSANAIKSFKIVHIRAGVTTLRWC